MSKSRGRKGSKTSNPMEGLPSKPRLCRLEKGSGGYGFNLHGEKGKHGQFIRAVDPGSPADVAGVKPGDRVIEVSGTNIERETHSQVVARIRADGGSTVLLVADRELDSYCKEHNITIKVDMIEEDEAEDDDPPHVNGINGSVDAVVEIEHKSEQPKIENEERIETQVEQREESQPEVIAVPDPDPEPESEEAQEPEEEPRPYENDVGVDEEVAAVTEAAEVHAEPPEPEREPTPEPEPEREPTPEPPREPTPPPPEPEREPTPPPPEPVREPTPPPPEPVREPTPPPPEIEEVDAPVPLQTEPKVSQPPARPPAPKVESTGLDLSDMAKARALAAGQRKKKQAAQQDWRSKYNAFNQL